jgi:hypothetical protein
MVHPDLFDEVRMPVLRATDRLRVLAPVIDDALRQHHGPNWGEVLAQQDRRAGRSTSGLYDPRYLLRLITHEPGLVSVFDADARDKARRLLAMANFVAHRDYRRLRTTDRLMAGVLADGLLKAAGLEVDVPRIHVLEPEVEEPEVEEPDVEELDVEVEQPDPEPAQQPEDVEPEATVAPERTRRWGFIATVISMAMLLPASAVAWPHAQRWVTDNWFLVSYPPTDSDESCKGAHQEPRPRSVSAAVICRHWGAARTVTYQQHSDRASVERRFARLLRRYPNALAACRRFGAAPGYLGRVPVACIKDFNELTIVWTDADSHVYAKVHRIGSGGRRLWNWWMRNGGGRLR